MTGNEALALGALHAGVKVVTGYPGTPSTGALASLLEMQPAGVHVEWSTNEKVAFEIAAGAAWAGQRALCTMKMSGLNVAYDSLISIAYSGVIGGLVIYVADDPGVSAGMVEQDSRGFALMSDLPMLDPVSVQDAYDLTRAAFDLSEAIGTPVFVRLVTANASSFSAVEIPDEPPASAWPERQPVLIRDINVFTKAGAVIAMTQHRDVIARLEKAGAWIAERGLNELRMANAWQMQTNDEGRRTRTRITQYAARSRSTTRHRRRRHHRSLPGRGVRDREPLRLRPGGGFRAADRQRPSAADRADPGAAAALRHDPGAGGAGADHRERGLRRGAAAGLGRHASSAS